ncbi:MAG: DUF1295 domain-containing protein [Bacteroidales bacterium]|nr:DUF1295 domain-containing protein [Bacteroidales bacterium]MCF6342267.1 DUF1295 domain-containing protein [Bacteroidales bacterium]
MKQKVKDLLYILFIYLLALGAAILILKYAPIPSILWKTALADFVAMVVVFIFSFIKKNSSVYDPFWSAAPIFIVFYWLFQIGETNFLFKAIWALVIMWGVRLTWNWILRWDGFEDEDWRYVLIRKKTGKAYWLASFFGIHLFPTALVFAGLVPVYFTFHSDISLFNSWVALVPFMFTISAIMLEKTADDELRHHMESGKGKKYKIQTPAWTLLKYPNYFGEMGFWWGMFLFAIAVDKYQWWTAFGPAAITLMFFFISIPMMKKHLAGKIYG